MTYHSFRFLTLAAVALCALGALTACSSWHRADQAAVAPSRMRGLTKEDVLACMGPAKKKAHEGATEVWTYDSNDGAASSSADYFTPLKGYTHASGSRSKNFCLVHVVLTNGVVTRVNYTGPASTGWFVDNDECGYAVANCVGPVSQ